MNKLLSYYSHFLITKETENKGDNQERSLHLLYWSVHVQMHNESSVQNHMVHLLAVFS